LPARRVPDVKVAVTKLSPVPEVVTKFAAVAVLTELAKVNEVGDAPTVKGTVETVAAVIVAAEAAPAVRAETATAAIRIFFIDIVMIPLEVL
jgi:hypothetical protein